VVFGPDPAVAEGRVEVPAERLLIHHGYTRSHHALLRVPERMRDPHPSTKDDLAILEFDLATHGAELKSAGIELAGIGSRSLYQPIIVQTAEGWQDSWALISFWEPVEVHPDWIDRMRCGLTSEAHVLKLRTGWRRAAETADGKDDTTCSLCLVR